MESNEKNETGKEQIPPSDTQPQDTKTTPKRHEKMLWDIDKIKRVAKLVVIILLCIFAIIMFRKIQRHNYFRADRQVDINTITISDISSVDQLKVMSIYKEILVSKEKPGPIMGMPENKIYAIYPARLQLGFDLSKCDKDWITTRHDTTFVTLPPIEMLNANKNLVDEAAKKVPIQNGTWSGSEMNDLREMANQKMLNQCTNEGCFEEATEQGKMVVANLLMALGCKNIVVNVTPRAITPTN